MSGYRFDGKTVVVTGGASGIGAAIAEGFAAAGACVFVADLSGDGAEVLAAALRAKGHDARSQSVDVADEASVASLVAAVPDGIDVLVCAAGIFAAGTAEATAPSTWRQVIEVNLTGTFLCARAAIPAMRRRGGSILTISSSTGAHDALPGAVAYVASKGGVTLLTKALACDHAAEGIRVNALAPGPTETPMLLGLMDEEARLAFGNSLPVRRLGQPAEFVGAALFLASEAASFVTGAILAIDGGQTAQV